MQRVTDEDDPGVHVVGQKHEHAPAGGPLVHGEHQDAVQVKAVSVQ